MTLMNMDLATRHRRPAAEQRLEVERAAFLGLAVAVTTAFDGRLYGDDPNAPTPIPGPDLFESVEYVVEPSPYLF